MRSQPGRKRPRVLIGEDLALVRTIVELGSILGLRVVAEGIENAAQLGALQRLGCSLGQGYHLCRPSNAEDLPPILGRSSLLERADDAA
jgi:EAL domain-containing protein (putative c-di-GMP-specific phosphodiesterase class I)